MTKPDDQSRVKKKAQQSAPTAPPKEDKLSDGADEAASYYEESEYDEEEEYESEEEEHQPPAQPAKVGGWTDQGSDGGITGQIKPKIKLPPRKKDFDPRTDKMLDINSNEDFLMESLKDFKPPVEQSLDKTHISALEKIIPSEKKSSIRAADAKVVAGVQMKNMMDNEQDLQEIMQLENPNYLMEEQFRKT